MKRDARRGVEHSSRNPARQSWIERQPFNGTLPPVPRQSPASPAASYRRANLRDVQSVTVGLALTLGVHAAVVLSAVRVGSDEGNVSRGSTATDGAPAEDETIIEGALLRQGGGGEWDPRHALHRVVPILAERSAATSLTTADSARERAPDSLQDPTARVTSRDILGRGNQDLAERLQRMAQSEAETSPDAPPGPGSPEGSIHGTETDPNRAGHGAHAKIQSFLQRNLHLLATAPASARRTFLLRIVIAPDGASIARGSVVQGSGDDTVDSDLAVQIAQLAENHALIPELTDDERTAIMGRSFRVRYMPE